MRDCEHGSLARSCEICQRDAEIAELREKLEGTRLMAQTNTSNFLRQRKRNAALRVALEKIAVMECGPHKGYSDKCPACIAVAVLQSAEEEE